MLIINQADVIRALPMERCIAEMRRTLAALARGEAVQPLRNHIMLPDRRGLLGMMPGYLAPARALGIKVITIFHANEGTSFDSHQGAVLLFEEEHGSLVAIMDATAITAIRTAAVSGLATDLLAPPGAGDLAVLGAGTQALTHIEAIQCVRPLRRLRLWNRTAERARRLAELVATRFGLKPEICSSVAAAVAGAEIVCTTTGAKDPILRSEWVSEGAHLNVVGSSVPSKREVDSALVARSVLFVDRRESALNEAGDIMIPLKEGLIAADHIAAELGDVILGSHPGRRSKEEITLFKSQGLAVEDLGSARLIYDSARAGGLGTEVQFGGRTHGEVQV
jgi:ornithine cyclodeaminase/alanine dehydrogenase-like protein (mu-crystallin family)